uniref:Reverse transcriptase domain-containing protein n=1 Tax=Cyprinus carpio TaxID=7962 RepID=A0A8C2L4R0_CYPCA
MAAVRTNNNIPSYFQLQRGTRQGCPLSPLLFAIAIEPLAIAVRQSSVIKGINRMGFVHKVSLYADDTLLFISDPLSSIPELLILLGKFGRISGYKVNVQKSEMMPVTSLEGKLTGTVPFKVSLEKFKYLGIWITRNFKNLYRANYHPLLANLKQDIARWESLPLSLGGRINLVKMIILPKFLYLFQTLPIFLSKSFFSNLNSQLSSFVWNKKHPRINKKILQLPRNLGGMALPNFMYYYWAANIRAWLHWLRRNTSLPSWVTLERASITSSSPTALLCSRLPFKQSISTYSSNPVVVHTVKIWNQCRRSFGFTGLLFAAPVSNNHMFIPSVTDEAFNSWALNRLRSLYNLYICLI